MLANQFLEELSHLTFNHSYFFSSGTSAIYHLLRHLSPGDTKVAFTDNTCFQVTLPSLWLDHAITYVDINHIDLQIDINKIEDIIRDVDVFIWVHQYGLVTSLRHIRSLCDTYSTILVEDACQSFPSATYQPEVGRYSDYLILSFGVGKLISTSYGGGLLLSKDKISISSSLNTLDFKFYKPIAEPQAIYFNKIYNCFYFTDSELFSFQCKLYLSSLNPISLIYQPSLKQFNEALECIQCHETILEQRHRQLLQFYSMDLTLFNYLLPFTHQCIPWRLTFLLPKSVGKLLPSLLSQNFPVSSWYPSLTYCVKSYSEAVAKVPYSLSASHRILNYDLNSLQHTNAKLESLSRLIDHYL